MENLSEEDKICRVIAHLQYDHEMDFPAAVMEAMKRLGVNSDSSEKRKNQFRRAFEIYTGGKVRFTTN